MDVFYEQFLSKDYGKQPKIFEFMKQIFLVLTVFNLVRMSLTWTILMLVLYFIVFMIINIKFLEYEYELTCDELIISKIINKKSRKIIGKINIRDVVNIKSLNDSLGENNIKIINASLSGLNCSELNEKILFVRQSSTLIGYKVAMDKKLYGMCKMINPIIFK